MFLTPQNPPQSYLLYQNLFRKAASSVHSIYRNSVTSLSARWHNVLHGTCPMHLAMHCRIYFTATEVHHNAQAFQQVSTSRSGILHRSDGLYQEHQSCCQKTFTTTVGLFPKSPLIIDGRWFGACARVHEHHHFFICLEAILSQLSKIRLTIVVVAGCFSPTSFVEFWRRF